MKQNKRSFTLVEILMVTGIICIIAALILVTYNGVYQSWSTGNTVAAMKAAHLALDKYMLENGSYPVEAASSELGKLCKESSSDSDIIKTAKKKLFEDLLQDCSPYSYKKSNGDLLIYDDYGPKPPKDPKEIFYRFPMDNSKGFALFSKGKNGEWGNGDDIVYLSQGDSDRKPGFYRCSVEDNSGKLEIDTGDEVEPIAQ